MIGDVKMQTINRRIGRSLTGDRPLFLANSEFADDFASWKSALSKGIRNGIYL